MWQLSIWLLLMALQLFASDDIGWLLIYISNITLWISILVLGIFIMVRALIRHNNWRNDKSNIAKPNKVMGYIGLHISGGLTILAALGF